jgi:hypothetical protein
MSTASRAGSQTSMWWKGSAELPLRTPKTLAKCPIQTLDFLTSFQPNFRFFQKDLILECAPSGISRKRPDHVTLPIGRPFRASDVKSALTRHHQGKIIPR